jgi:hypothetical protein
VLSPGNLHPTVGGKISMSEKEPKKAPKKKRINIEFPKDLEAVYANVAFISHTPAEMIVDFAQVLPRIPKGNVVSRIIMSPMHAKMLHKALAQNIANYEGQFGEIRLPQQMSIADNFFKFPPGSSDDDDPPDKE